MRIGALTVIAGILSTGQKRHSGVSGKQHLRSSSHLVSTRSSMYINYGRTQLTLLQNPAYPCQWLDWRECGGNPRKAALDNPGGRKADLGPMLGSYSSITEQARMSRYCKDGIFMAII